MIRRMYSDTGTTGAGAWRDASLCLLVGRLWGHGDSPERPSTTLSMQNSMGNSKMTLRSREKYQKMFKNAFEDAQQSRNSEDIDVAKGVCTCTHEDHLG